MKIHVLKLAAGMIISGLLIAPVIAGPNDTPAAPKQEGQAMNPGPGVGDQVAPKQGMSKVERDRKRSEAKKRAEAKRNAVIKSELKKDAGKQKSKQMN